MVGVASPDTDVVSPCIGVASLDSLLLLGEACLLRIADTRLLLEHDLDLAGDRDLDNASFSVSGENERDLDLVRDLDLLRGAVE